jgi:hypothetical protein
MEARSKVLGLRTAIIALLLLMPVGSPGDRVALILFALLLTSRTTVHVLRDLSQGSCLLTCAMYSIAIVATWANSRYRLGGGPFHLAVAGVWRGYPLPYQEYGLQSTGTVWLEYSWAAALGDALLIAIVVSVVTYFAKIRMAQVPRILLLSAYCLVLSPCARTSHRIARLPAPRSAPSVPLHLSQFLDARRPGKASGRFREFSTLSATNRGIVSALDCGDP